MSFRIVAPGPVNIDLPRWPSRITHKLQADVKETRFPGGLPLLLAFGRKANKLEIEGILQRSGYTKIQLTTTYIAPIDVAIYKTVEITAPYDSPPVTQMQYGGKTYVFAGASFEERPGVTRAFFYTMEFWEGSQIITL